MKGKQPYIPPDVYKLGLTINELMFYLWGRTQSASNFKFSDRGAATMLNCHPNTIVNLRKSLERKRLLKCIPQERNGGKFGGSKWIFYDKPYSPETPKTTKRNSPPKQPQEDDDNYLPF